MAISNNIKILKDVSKALLNCGDDFLTMKQSVDRLYEMFMSITGIDISNLNEDHILLPSGKAISPSGAAHCLLEMKRTAIFLRGIKQAIDSKIQSADKLIRILYAGCGPYATLVIPLLNYYPEGRVIVTFLDVNRVSLSAAEKLITQLGLEEYVEQFVLADATTYKVDKSYDVIISETMQSGLKKEPLVAIAQNLIPQCSPDTIFIPEQITIDAYLHRRGVWDGDKLLEAGGETSHLCELFTVTKTNLDSSKYRKIVTLPQKSKKPYDLFLYTTINVFGNEVLGLNDCSLNLPLRYFEIRNGYPNTFEFWYNQSDKPQIESKVLDYIA